MQAHTILLPARSNLDLDGGYTWTHRALTRSTSADERAALLRQGGAARQPQGRLRAPCTLGSNANTEYEWEWAIVRVCLSALPFHPLRFPLILT